MRWSCCKADHPSLAALVERAVKKSTIAKLDAPVRLDADDQEVLRQVVGLLSRDVEAIARGAAVSGSARPRRIRR